MFDNVCKFLAETFPADFATWLLGQPIQLTTPDLLPFAVLSQTDDPPQVLQQVAQAIEQINDPRAQSNLTASTSILAGLVRDSSTVAQEGSDARINGL